ncbi:MAG: hypothetical protein R3F60_10620 [bacterium]
MAPPYLGRESLRAFEAVRTALEGGRLLGSSIIWAAVALAGLSSPEELALQLGLGVAHGQVPWGSEAEALGAIPAIVRASVERIVGGVIASGQISAQELRYWEGVQARLGGF